MFEKQKRSATLCVWTMLIACGWWPSSKLQAANSLAQMTMEVWGIEQGLPSNSVKAILQSRDGYLWFATEEGLARFDGIRFTVFNRSNTPELNVNSIDAITETQDGTLWIGSARGLTFFRNGHFSHLEAKQGLPSEAVLGIFEDRKGDVWVGTRAGVRRFRAGAVLSFPGQEELEGDSIRSFAEDSSGGLWLGSRRGLLHLDRGKLRLVANRLQLGNDYIRSLCFDNQQVLWIGTNGGGITRYSDGHFTPFTETEGLPSNSVMTLRAIGTDGLWIGLNGAGLARIQDGHLEKLAPPLLPGGVVHDILRDKENSYWIGTGGNGLIRLRHPRFNTLTRVDGLTSEVVLPILQDSLDRIWIGTAGGGLHLFENGRLRAIPATEGPPHGVILSLAEHPAGTIWVGSAGGGLSRFQNGKWRTFTTREGLPNQLINAIEPARDGGLWIGTSGAGMAHFDGRTFRSFSRQDGLPDDIISALHEDREGVLWIGTENGGLARCIKGRIEPVDTGRPLLESVVLCFYEDKDGDLWVGTGGGGLRYIQKNRVSVLTTREGLFDDVVSVILADDTGNFWMSCNKGIFRTAQRELADRMAGRTDRVSFTAYGKADGMPSVECNGGVQPPGWKIRDGRLWFPTVRGVVIVNPSRLDRNPLPPSVYIENLRLDGLEQSLQESVSIPAGVQNLEIQYTGLSYIAPGACRFRYRLEGFDPDWVEARARRVAYYTRVPAGTYRFWVQASNNDGVWNRIGAKLELKIKARFYETQAFFGLNLIMLCGAAFAVHLMRTRGLHRKQATLEALAEERRKAADALQESESRLRVSQERLHLALEAAEQGHWDWDVIRNRTILSYRCMAILGSGQAESEGPPVLWTTRVHPEDSTRVRISWEFLLDGEKDALGMEYRLDSTPGRECWVSGHAQVVNRGEDGKPLRLIGACADISERKLLETQFRQAQKMESVGRLAGGVAHDFNNMLGVILGHAEMAIDNVDPGQPIYADLEEIQNAALRSADLTRQLLAFARKQVVSLKVLDLNDTLARMLKMLQRLIGEGIHLDWVPGLNLWPIQMDPSQIDQILANLCINARDAIAGVGKIIIKTENITLDKDFCANHAGSVPGEYVLLTVSDAGCGMDEETLEKIFEPFFTTKGIGKGTGLGLSTVYGIVKQNNGFINVHSKPDRGTTFQTYLPKWEGQKEPLFTDGFRETPIHGLETILLVEDEPSLLKLNKQMLESQGYRVLAVGSPGQAIRLAAEHKNEINLLLTDIVMPEMNGRDLATNLLGHNPQLKCLYTSGYTANVIVHHCVLDKGAYFIQKPFSKKELAIKVREVLDGK